MRRISSGESVENEVGGHELRICQFPASEFSHPAANFPPMRIDGVTMGCCNSFETTGTATGPC